VNTSFKRSENNEVHKTENRTGIFLIILALCLLFPVVGMSASSECEWIDKVENLTITSGKSVILCSETPIKTFLQADDKEHPVVNIFALNPYKFYLTGKSPGVTNLTFYDEKINSPQFLTWR